MSDRLSYIDIAKAIGLILVILSHSVYPEFITLFLYCDIPVFFLCSGFTQKKDISIWKKFKKLMIPYFVFNIGYILFARYFGYHIYHAMGRLTTDNIIGIFYGTFSLYPPAPHVHNHYFLTILNSPTWFLMALFVSSIWFKLILSVQTGKWRYLLIISYLVLTSVLSQLPILLPFQLTSSFFFAILMWVGYAVRQNGLLGRKLLLPIILLLYGLCYYFNGKGVNLSVSEYGRNILLCLIAAIAGSLFLIYIGKWLSRYRILRDLFLSINRHALTLFCIQLPILYGFEELALKYINQEQNWMLCLFALGQLIGTIIIGRLIGKYLNKLFPSVFS